MERSTVTADAIQPEHTNFDAFDSNPKDELELNLGGRGATQRRLRNYQVTMIGFCSGIGTGLFVGTGSAYAKAGPAGLLLAYIVVGMVLWCVMQSIAELATLLPTAGSFPHWATRFIDPSVGFSLAISYGYCYTIAIASEVSAAAVIVSYWTDITPAMVITISLVLILAINLMSVRFYGETEVIGGAIKILCFLGLVIVSIVITAGGGPNHETIGFRFWDNPGPWTNFNGIVGPAGHFLGFLSSFVNASFSFIGVETVVITAAESVDPHRSIPKAARRVTYRIAFFYILGALLIGIIVNPTNKGLTSGDDNANSSPFVIAIKEAGITALPSIVNACILVAAWSAGNSYCWVGSRMIVAMTTDRQLPQIFGRVDKKGVPYISVIVAWLFGPLAYLSKCCSHLTPSLQTSNNHRSWNWRCRPGFHLAFEPEHGCRSDCLGYSLVLLHPFPRGNEGTGCFPRYPPLEGAFAAICRVDWFHWLHNNHIGCRFPRVPEGQLEHI